MTRLRLLLLVLVALGLMGTIRYVPSTTTGRIDYLPESSAAPIIPASTTSSNTSCTLDAVFDCVM